LSADIDLVADFEVGGRSSSFICRTLVLELSGNDLLSEFLMELVKVDDVFSSLFGRDVTLRMNCQIRMITFVGEER
jgi:hypothetical protein